MRRFHVQTVEGGNEWRMGARGRATSIDVRLRWLHASVKPSIIKLVAIGRLKDVLSVLGLEEHVTIIDKTKEETSSTKESIDAVQ